MAPLLRGAGIQGPCPGTDSSLKMHLADSRHSGDQVPALPLHSFSPSAFSALFIPGSSWGSSEKKKEKDENQNKTNSSFSWMNALVLWMSGTTDMDGAWVLQIGPRVSPFKIYSNLVAEYATLPWSWGKRANSCVLLPSFPFAVFWLPAPRGPRFTSSSQRLGYSEGRGALGEGTGQGPVGLGG